MNNDSVVLEVSRSGRRYSSYAGLHLNSPYDPVREASRFLEAHDTIATAFVILGDTLPYLRTALHERFPEAEIVSVYFHRDFPVTTGEGSSRPAPDDYWSPASKEPLRSYLVRRLSTVQLDGISILQWPPAYRAFPDLAETATRTVEQVVRESTGEWVTTAAFSRAWTHNLLANFLSIERWHLLESHHKPVVVAASGPSLARAIPVIRTNRKRIALVALPSSLEALAAADLPPDLLVTVDAGYWAQLHLRALDSFGAAPVALPLTASRGLWRSSSLPVIFSTGSFIERELLLHANLAPLEILESATVSATALELAGRWTDGPLLVAGLDLSYAGLDEHVRPHAFDTHFESTASRTRPHLSVVAERLLKLGFDRSKGTPGVTPALKTYAGWFREWKGAGRVYRLFPSRISLEGFISLSDPTSFLADWSETDFTPAPLPSPTPPLPERKNAVSRMLDSWSETLRAASRSQVREPHRAAAIDRDVDALLSSLVPREYLRYRRSLRLQPGGSTDGRDLLFDEAIDEVAGLKRRFLP